MAHASVSHGPQGHEHADGHGHEHGHHIVPQNLLLKVFGALVGLTIFTVLSAQVDLGALNVPLALAIAGTKAFLVVAFFMALKYDRKINLLVFAVGSIFVLVFLSFTLFDTVFRGDLTNTSSETIQDMQRREEALRAREPGAAAPAAGADTTGAASDTTAATGADTTAAAAGAGTAPPASAAPAAH